MKINEGQQLKFFASYTVYVDTGKFQTTNITVFASQFNTNDNEFALILQMLHNMWSTKKTCESTPSITRK